MSKTQTSNAIDSGLMPPALYFYRFWKAKTHHTDFNNDWKVNSLDAAIPRAHWYSPPAVGPLGYAPQADQTGGTGGSIGGGIGFVKGIPDGRAKAH